MTQNSSAASEAEKKGMQPDGLYARQPGLQLLGLNMYERVRAEGEAHGRAMDFASVLARISPRLTGSPNVKRATRRCQGQLKGRILLLDSVTATPELDEPLSYPERRAYHVRWRYDGALGRPARLAQAGLLSPLGLNLETAFSGDHEHGFNTIAFSRTVEVVVLAESSRRFNW